MQAEAFMRLPKSKRPLRLPDFTANDVLDIDFKHLKSLGVEYILIDLDLTLRKKMSRKLEPAIIEFLNASKQQYGFKSINLVSNNMTNLRRYAEPLGAQIFQPFWRGLWLVRKPNPRFYARVLATLNAKPASCVMIGDKVRADVSGGNTAGMFTVLVKPRGRDFLYDTLLFTRLRERRDMRKYRQQNKGTKR